jgi:hypothetical protein
MGCSWGKWGLFMGCPCKTKLLIRTLLIVRTMGCRIWIYGIENIFWMLAVGYIELYWRYMDVFGYILVGGSRES